jgi:hypothetical protein
LKIEKTTNSQSSGHYAKNEKTYILRRTNARFGEKMLENGKIRPLKKMNHHVVRKYEKDRRATVSQMNRVCVVDYRIVMTQSFTPRHPVPVANSLERGRFVYLF